MNLMRYKWVYFGVSLLIILPGTIALILWGLKPGIDFTGGSLMEIRTTKAVSTDSVQSAVAKQVTSSDILVQTAGKNEFFIRTKVLDQKAHVALRTDLQNSLQAQELSFESVGPTIGADVTRKAIYSVILAAFAIVMYVAWAFRRVPHTVSSWQFGLSTIAALVHDVLLLCGVFAILGHFLGVEVDSLFVTALLTVIGFSVHDTIVVFDRIRENLRRYGGEDFQGVVNSSIVETLARSINTSLTVLLVLVTLFIYGGETIRYFVLALLVGIASGTYSSIFNAAPVLLVWQQWRSRRSVKQRKV
jgi:preprotein translocase subunit SecF